MSNEWRTIVYRGREIEVRAGSPANLRDYERYWGLLRIGVMLRDHFQCTICDSIIDLQVAHLNHNTRDNDPSNLRTLCVQCHREFDFANSPAMLAMLEKKRQSAAKRRMWETRRARYGPSGGNAKK